MQLTRFSRFLIVVAILAVIFFIYKKYAPGLQEKFGAPAATEQVEQPVNTNPEKPQSNQQNQEEAAAQSQSAFNYQAPVPVNGKLRGVVELGAAGFNSFVVLMDKEKNWKLEKAEFGSSLVHEHMATDDDVRM